MLKRILAIFIGLIVGISLVLAVDSVFLLADFNFKASKRYFNHKRLEDNYSRLLSSEYEMHNSIKTLKTFPDSYNFPTEDLLQETIILQEGEEANNIDYARAYEKMRMIARRKSNNEVVYDVVATLGEFGRRVSVYEQKETSSQHLYVMGGSFVFGIGLEDEQTLPWLLNKSQLKYRVYNLGFSGYGPNDLLARALNHFLFPSGGPKKGVAVYVFNSHFDRALNTMEVVAEWASHMSAVGEISPGKFKYLGQFEEVYPLRTKVYKWFWNRFIVQYFRLNWPIYTDERYDYVGRMIAALREEYWQSTSRENEFYVVFYPHPIDSFDRQKMRQALEKQKIYFLDYSVHDISHLTDKPAVIKYDGHPNELANQIFSQLLIKDLLDKLD